MIGVLCACVQVAGISVEVGQGNVAGGIWAGAMVGNFSSPFSSFLFV